MGFVFKGLRRLVESVKPSKDLLMAAAGAGLIVFGVGRMVNWDSALILLGAFLLVAAATIDW